MHGQSTWFLACIVRYAILVDVRDSRTQQAEKGVSWAFLQAACLKRLPLMAIQDQKGATFTEHTLKIHLQG